MASLLERLGIAGFTKPLPNRGLLDDNGAAGEGDGLEFLYSPSSNGSPALAVYDLCDGLRARLIWPSVTAEDLAVLALHSLSIRSDIRYRAAVKALQLIAVIGASRLGDTELLKVERSPT